LWITGVKFVFIFCASWGECDSIIFVFCKHKKLFSFLQQTSFIVNCTKIMKVHKLLITAVLCMYCYTQKVLLLLIWDWNFWSKASCYETPIQIISIHPNASLAGGVGVLEAFLECFSFCQAKNLYWSSLDILCIVKVVITQCFLAIQRGVLHEAMSLKCGECDSTPMLCSTSSCWLRVEQCTRTLSWSNV